MSRCSSAISLPRNKTRLRWAHSKICSIFGVPNITANYNWAKDRDAIQASPEHSIKIPGKAKVRTGIDTEDQLGRFWLALSEDPYVDDSLSKDRRTTHDLRRNFGDASTSSAH